MHTTFGKLKAGQKFIDALTDDIYIKSEKDSHNTASLINAAGEVDGVDYFNDDEIVILDGV